MRVLVVLISFLALTGCSAAGLKKAEENTRLAGVTSPLQGGYPLADLGGGDNR